MSSWRTARRWWSLSIKDKERRVCVELLDYARRFRLYIENNMSPASDSSNLTAWLEHTMVTSTNEQSYSFYSSLLINYKDRHSSYTHLLDSRPSHTKDSFTESPSFHDSLWNEADKGRGLTLLTTDQLKSEMSARSPVILDTRWYLVVFMVLVIVINLSLTIFEILSHNCHHLWSVWFWNLIIIIVIIMEKLKYLSS